MSALTFSLKIPLQFAVNCAVLSPAYLAGKSLAQIAALSIEHGRTRMRLDQVFVISGQDTQDLHIKNSSSQLDYLGANMGSGSLLVEGDAGMYLGFGMKGGEVHCLGNTKSFAACNMQNGLLIIDGNTVDFLAGASAGLRKGMAGGTVVLKGNAGDRVADQMRRGLVLIEGNVGDYCGSRMIAGTVGVLGNVGLYAGFSMRRGTLLFSREPQLHATMQACGSHTLPFLTLLLKSFAPYSTRFANSNAQRVKRWLGDAANNGMGEILLISD